MSKTRKASISSHPAFRWGVGAWFALLLGLGLFVMPAGVHQAIAGALGLGDMFDASALRLVLSALAAALGLAIGLVLAMRVAALNDADAENHEDEEADDLAGVWLDDDDSTEQDIAPDPGPRRPFNPLEDMEEEGIGAEPEGEPEPAEAGPLGLSEDEDSALMELWREEMGDDAPLPAPPVAADSTPREPEDAVFEEVDEVEDPIPASEDDTDDALYDPFAAVGQVAEDEPVEREAEAVGEEWPEDSTADWDDSYPPVENQPEAPPASAETADAPPPPVTEALGDLPLDALTQRLSAALESARGTPTAPAEETDPVIAFLRREADREAPEARASDPLSDPQAELRSALDKLSRVGKPE
ncbi:hypothetical protein [Qipengyuania flava]|uniref:hypothetical protein n=1 Tax=Qipengyuania flava TaxID=192812 RepID=UPI001C62C546|nr:hypothetical protein [Qipengyuania flava]QYJ07460.1 hypothetical protein KUV82_01670 [Qipengyuania flava]